LFVDLVFGFRCMLSPAGEEETLVHLLFAARDREFSDDGLDSFSLSLVRSVSTALMLMMCQSLDSCVRW
jgi:hypothetical protein